MDDLNTGLQKVHYSDVSVIQMFVIQISTVNTRKIYDSDITSILTIYQLTLYTDLFTETSFLEVVSNRCQLGVHFYSIKKSELQLHH